MVLHGILMGLGTILILIGAFVGAKDEGEKNINAHKTLGILGILVFLVGALLLVFSGQMRPNLLHFYLGLLTVLFLILTAIVGIVYTNAEKEKKMGYRSSHRAVAIVSAILLIATIIAGIFSVSLIK